MSTSATYRFKKEGADKFFYVHHDGYQSGAAGRFKLLLEIWARNPTAPYEDCFVEADPSADPTPSHGINIGTEYKYDLRMESNGIHVIAYSRKTWAWNEWERRQFVSFFGGTIQEFVDKYWRKPE
jgi:hypothetical protein